jgi:sulfate transport system permease protein
VFYKVTLPALRWGLVYGATLTTARAIGEFGAVLVVSGNILLLTQTATLHIYQNYVDFNYVGANAVALTLLAVSFAILIVLETAKAHTHAATAQT